MKNGFSHRQWSGYRSDEKLTDRQVRNLMLQMRNELTWMDKCSTKIDVTNIEKIYDIKAFYASYHEDQRDKDIEKAFTESEIKLFDSTRVCVKSLEERIKDAEKSVNGTNKSVSKNRELETYVK